MKSRRHKQPALARLRGGEKPREHGVLDRIARLLLGGDAIMRDAERLEFLDGERRLDRRIGPMFLNAGIGFGGFCFPKDLEAFYWISKQKGYDFHLLKSVKEINEHQKGWIARKIE